MVDCTERISRDLRTQQLIQKEISSQVFMYTIFIAFAGLVASPVLFGLTTNMIRITDQVWKGILASSPGGLPTTGLSLLKPHAPTVTVGEYRTFAYLAVAIITGFASVIISAITSGSWLKGLRLSPVFILIGIGIFLVVQHVVASLFANIGSI